jgi:hypothetical protein
VKGCRASCQRTVAHSCIPYFVGVMLSLPVATIGQCQDPSVLEAHYRRAIAANPRNAFILREFPAYVALYEQ